MHYKIYVFNIIGTEMYAKFSSCNNNVRRLMVGKVEDLDTCARKCDGKGQIFGIKNVRDCINEGFKGSPYHPECDCVCYIVPRNDDNAGTCVTEHSANLDVFRIVDGTL